MFLSISSPLYYGWGAKSWFFSAMRLLNNCTMSYFGHRACNEETAITEEQCTLHQYIKTPSWKKNSPVHTKMKSMAFALLYHRRAEIQHLSMKFLVKSICGFKYFKAPHFMESVPCFDLILDLASTQCSVSMKLQTQPYWRPLLASDWRQI